MSAYKKIGHGVDQNSILYARLPGKALKKPLGKKKYKTDAAAINVCNTNKKCKGVTMVSRYSSLRKVNLFHHVSTIKFQIDLISG